MHDRPSTRRRARWVVALGVAVLIVVHGLVLYGFSLQVALPAAVLTGAVVLVVLKHLGLIGSLVALLRRRRRRG